MQALQAYKGTFEGSGINHHGEEFVATLVLKPLIAGRGALLWFCAEGKNGDVFHEEITLIGPGPDGLELVSLNTNVETIQTFHASELVSGQAPSAVFTYGDLVDDTTFRERITLQITAPDQLEYKFEWGLPGEAISQRNTIALTRSQLPLHRKSPFDQ